MSPQEGGGLFRDRVRGRAVPRRAGPTTAFGWVVGRQAYTKICAAAMGIAAPIELQRSSGFIITQLAVDVR